MHGVCMESLGPSSEVPSVQPQLVTHLHHASVPNGAGIEILCFFRQLLLFAGIVHHGSERVRIGIFNFALQIAEFEFGLLAHAAGSLTNSMLHTSFPLASVPLPVLVHESAESILVVKLPLALVGGSVAPGHLALA